jgi:dCTP diphosphatase
LFGISDAAEFGSCISDHGSKSRSAGSRKHGATRQNGPEPTLLPGGRFALAFRGLHPNLPGMDQLNLGAILQLQREFVAARKWEKFHTPKNLSMALAGEAAELMEIFQWLTDAESRKVMQSATKARAVSHELADVFYYVLRLADTLGVNLEAAFREKMRHNQAKYPVTLAKGNARKYHELLVSKGPNPRKTGR